MFPLCCRHTKVPEWRRNVKHVPLVLCKFAWPLIMRSMAAPARDALRDLLERPGRRPPIELLGRVYAVLERAPGPIPVALYRGGRDALALERSNVPGAPAELQVTPALRAATASAGRPVSLAEPGDAGEALAALRHAEFEHVVAGLDGGGDDGLLAVGRAPDGEARELVLELGALALACRRLRRERDEADGRYRALKALDEVGAAQSVAELGFVAVHKLSGALDHDLAAFATVGHGRARVVAVSGREAIDRRDPGVVRLEALAGAAAEGGREAYAVLGRRPPEAPGAGRGFALLEAAPEATGDLAPVARAAHADLSASGLASVAALPLRVDGRVRAVLIVLGRGELLSRTEAFERLEAYRRGTEAALARLLDLRDIPFVRPLEALRPLARALGAVRHGRAAKVLAALSLVVALLALVERDLDVEGACRTVAGRRTAVRAPRDGVLASISVRPGERVTKGRAIATLAAEPPHEGETPILAPADGVLSGDDLEARLGETVRAGRRLALVDAADGARIEVEVDELDLEVVAAGAGAEVRLAGASGPPVVARVAEVRSLLGAHGEARFVAVLDPVEGPGVAPGIAGRARVHCGRHPMGYVLFRRLAAAIRLRFWL